MKNEFTGKHMAATMIGGFGIVVAVNLVMANYATSTFGGVVVENSYVASQEFNDWLASAEESRALGWKVTVDREAGGLVAVSTENVPEGAQVRALARHPLGREPDTPLTFAQAGASRFVSTAPLPDGRWTVRLEVTSGEDRWRGEQALR